MRPRENIESEIHLSNDRLINDNIRQKINTELLLDIRDLLDEIKSNVRLLV